MAPTYDALGPDALRLWVAGSDYTRDVVIGEPVLKATSTSLLKYRTTIKMLLGSMNDNALNLPLTTLDKIALVQLDRAMVGVWEAWQTYEFHKAVSIINRWVNVDLSSFYLEGIKDRLYCGDGGGVLYHVFQGLLKMLAPITPMLVEEAWDHRPAWLKNDTYVLSSHCLRYPLVYPFHLNHQLTPYHRNIQHPLHQILDPKQPLAIERSLYADVEPDIHWLLNANTAIKTAQEEARAAKLIGSSLQSCVILEMPETAKAMFDKYLEDLEAIFVVSSVELAGAGAKAEASVGSSAEADVSRGRDWEFSAEFDVPGGGKGVAHVMPPKQAKCPRCWRYVASTEEELCKRCEEVVA